jgi:LmbE family N-acetylglucosaminyl deacetylase
MLHDPDATRLLAISPHLNDAVLSIGAGLAQAAQDGAKVTVYTVFAGTAPPPYSPAAERMHAVWGLSPNDDASLYRRKEDIAALGHLGVAWRHGRFLDSIYRTLPDGQWLTAHVEGGAKLAVTERSADSDRELVAEIRDDLTSIVDEFDPTLLVTCAAILDHPDNQAARDAALFTAHEKKVPILLWEDLPYAIFRPDTVELPQSFHRGSPHVSSVTEEMRKRKFQAVECYSSQLAMLNGRDNNLFDRLDEHARKTSQHGGYGETTWPVVRSEDNS